MNNGFVKLRRKIMNSTMWEKCNSNTKVLYLTLLMEANYTSSIVVFKNKRCILKRGQYLTTVGDLAILCGKGFTTKTIRHGLEMLIKYNLITVETSTKRTLITVIDYNETQKEDKKEETEKQSDKKGANKKIDENPVNSKDFSMSEKKGQTCYKRKILNYNHYNHLYINNKSGDVKMKPKLEDVILYANSLEKNHIDPTLFFEMYDARDWRDANGNIIRFWQKLYDKCNNDHANKKLVNRLNYQQSPHIVPKAFHTENYDEIALKIINS